MVWEDAAALWKAAKNDIAVAEAQERIYRRILEDMIMQMDNVDRVEGGGIRATKTRRIGNVDYKRIPQLEGVDLNAYRNPPTTYIKLSAIDAGE
jgi:hypothetical protein